MLRVLQELNEFDQLNQKKTESSKEETRIDDKGTANEVVTRKAIRIRVGVNVDR